MNLSTRSLLVPTTALATAGVLALAPTVVAPAPTSLAAPLAAPLATEPPIDGGPMNAQMLR